MKKSHPINLNVDDVDFEELDQYPTDDELIDRAIERCREHRFRICRPPALTWHGWRRWDARVAAEFPVRDWYFNKFLHFFDVKWSRFTYRLGRIKWAVYHRYLPKYQYHVLRPSTLEPGYHDPCDRILHAAMEDLRQFYELGVQDIVWDADDDHQAAYEEIKAIYNWWVNVYPHREENMDAELPVPECPDHIPDGFGWMFNEDFENDPTVQEWKRISDLRYQREMDWIKEEEEMLIRLIKIRTMLWYA